MLQPLSRESPSTHTANSRHRPANPRGDKPLRIALLLILFWLEGLVVGIAKPSLLITHATLLPIAAEAPQVLHGYMAVGADGKILAIGAGDPPPDAAAALETIDAQGMIVAPGFVSAHSHLSTSGSRGLGTDQTLYGWIPTMSRYTQKATAGDIYWLVLHGALDFLRNGITTAYDFADPGIESRWEPLSVGSAEPRDRLKSGPFQENQIQAKIDSGIRFFHSVWIPRGYSLEEARAMFRHYLDFCRAYSGDARFLGLAISGGVQWAAHPETAEIESALMKEFGLLDQAHFLEAAAQAEEQRAKFAWYLSAGALGPRFLFGHFIQTTPYIVATAAAKDCGMVWQPTSNGRLASG
ncbi:MAG: amidohydrolase family protein, partial [Methylacidiphilaceae bacterium]|nr:amidohydrolase family protein [Candidatus Methylacidiphilaceae bacterium]